MATCVLRNYLFAATLIVSSVALNATAYREVPMTDGWKQIFPGQETICARGGEFSFFYREGNESDKIVIDFAGGGACWSNRTCAEGSPLFIDNINTLKHHFIDEGPAGIYDHSNEKNPVKNWSHVVIPYCTGDIHWGDNITTYQERGEHWEDRKPITIFHKGAVNAKTVLDWTFAHHRVNAVFVTGASAGGYGSIYWLPYIKDHAADAAIFQFSDGAAGVIGKEGLMMAMTSWNAVKYAPHWIFDSNAIDWQEPKIVDWYSALGRYYPTIMLSQFNTSNDFIQTLFYDVMGDDDPLEWPAKALSNLEAINSNLDNFHYFHAGGESHTIIAEDNFYSLAVNEVFLVDWIENMLARTTMSNVICVECD